MKTPHIRKMFPGAVTANGFHSFYEYLIGNDAEHIFVIKGGPGVGKSTFMKKIAQEMLEKGYDLEYHCCSSDNNSLDGVVIPELGIAILDGTSPHIVDPKFPGAVDEILNFGEYWNEEMIKPNRAQIKEYSRSIKRFFQTAYLCLKQAMLAMEEWELYITDYQDWNKINSLYLDIEHSIFTKKLNKNAKERHLFAWGHTPQGKVNHIDSLLQDISKVYAIDGQPGTGKSTFLANIARRAILLGYDVELYHNTLQPDKLDLIILPELEIAFVIVAAPYQYTPNIEAAIETLNFDQYLKQDTLKLNQAELADCRRRVDKNIERALRNSAQAKAQHDLLEKCYYPAMDFEGIENMRAEIVSKILSKI